MINLKKKKKKSDEGNTTGSDEGKKTSRQSQLSYDKRQYLEGKSCNNWGELSEKCRNMKPDGKFITENFKLIPADFNFTIKNLFQTLKNLEDDDQNTISSLVNEKLSELFFTISLTIYWWVDDDIVGQFKPSFDGMYCPLGNDLPKEDGFINCKYYRTDDTETPKNYNNMLSAYLDIILLILSKSDIMSYDTDYISTLIFLLKKIVVATGSNIKKVNLDIWRDFSTQLNTIYGYEIFTINCINKDYPCGRALFSTEVNKTYKILLFDTESTNDDRMNMRTFTLWVDELSEINDFGLKNEPRGKGYFVDGHNNKEGGGKRTRHRKIPFSKKSKKRTRRRKKSCSKIIT